MNILFWIVSLGLVAFEMVASIGKTLRREVAVDWMTKLGLSDPFMMAFGGLETGAAGVILWSLFNKGDFTDKLVPWACLM